MDLTLSGSIDIPSFETTKLSSLPWGTQKIHFLGFREILNCWDFWKTFSRWLKWSSFYFEKTVRSSRYIKMTRLIKPLKEISITKLKGRTNIWQAKWNLSMRKRSPLIGKHFFMLVTLFHIYLVISWKTVK